MLARRTSLTLICTALILVALSVSSATTETRSERLSAAAKMHREKATTLGRVALEQKAPHTGTAFNEMGLEEFFCASLAMLLGKDQIFLRLGRLDDFVLTQQMTEDKLHDLAFSVLFHDNWAIAAEKALSLSERDRIELWNLQCVNHHEIGREHYMPRLGKEATFRVDGDQLRILGDINRGFYESFRSTLDNHKQVRTVALGSGGGSVQDAMLSGLLIRQRRLDTVLFADCYSACPLIFLGGLERSVWSPYPRLGFHQVSVDGRPLSPEHEVYNVIARYAERMGANSAFLLELMHKSGPFDMTYPPVWELCGPKFTTWVQRGC